MTEKAEEKPKAAKSASYVVLRGFDTPSGTRCEIGDEIELSTKEATSLLAVEAIKES